MHVKLLKTLFMLKKFLYGNIRRKYNQNNKETEHRKNIDELLNLYGMEWNRYVIIKLVFIIYLMQVKVVLNEGQVKFRNINFSGSFKKLLPGNYCTDLYSCNIIFEICLTPYDYKHICIIESNSDTVITKEVKEIDFNLPQRYSGAMSLVIRGVDKNSPPKDNLVFRIEGRQKLTFLQPKWWSLSYEQNGVNVNLDYKLSCKQNYYGSTCNKLCIPLNDRFGHYRCSDKGIPVCYPGWYGPYCTKRTCRERCFHGRCDKKNTNCLCFPGWAGDKCNIEDDSCIIKKCRNNGKCYGNGRCKCLEGYNGTYCEQQVQVSSTVFTIKPSTSVIFVQHSTKETSRLKPSRAFSTRRVTTTHFTLASSEHIVTSVASVWVVSPGDSDVSPFNAKTSRIKVYASSLSVSFNSTATSPSLDKDGPSDVIVPIFSILSIILMAIGFLVLFMLWKRSKHRTNKRQTTPLCKLSGYADSLKSIPSGTSLSTVQSMLLTPITKTSGDTDVVTELETPNVGLMDVLEYPVSLSPTMHATDFEKYTIHAVDRMCWEAIRGPTSTLNQFDDTNTSHRNNKRKYRRLSREMSSKHFKNNKTTSNGSSGYCSSSGYNSSANSPAPKLSTSSSSRSLNSLTMENSFASVLCLIHDITENKAKVLNNTSTYGNNNNGNQKTTEQLENFEGVSTNSSDGEFNHSREVYDTTKFEGLPNYVCYNEDSELVL